MVNNEDKRVTGRASARGVSRRPAAAKPPRRSAQKKVARKRAAAKRPAKKTANKKLIKPKAAKKKTARRKPSTPPAARAERDAEVYVLSGVPPSVADVIVTSVDQYGRPGSLTSFVLHDTGTSEELLPTREELGDRGFAIRGQDKHDFIFITIPDDSKAVALKEGLLRAFKEYGERLAGRTLWMPLLAQWGPDGLVPELGLELAVIVVKSLATRASLRPGRVIISLYEKLPLEHQASLQELAERRLGRKIQRTFSSRPRFLPESRLDVLRFAFQLALERRLEPPQLLTPDLEELLAAARKLDAGRDDPIDLPKVYEQLEKQYHHLAPNALWAAWMRHTLGEQLAEIENELHGDVP